MSTKNKVSRLKIRIDNSDGTYTELGPTLIPYEVAEFLLCEAIDWKERWHFTPKEYEAYLESRDKFKEPEKQSTQ